jgi:Head domain of trimeric autotransporter adhesin
MKKLFLALLTLVLISTMKAQVITDTGALRTAINTDIVTNGTGLISATKLNRILQGNINALSKVGVANVYRRADSIFYLKAGVETLVTVLISNGTVNAGLLNRLAYYPNSNSTVGSLSALTGNRALITGVTGLPVASSVTNVELALLSGLTAISRDSSTASKSNSKLITEKAAKNYADSVIKLQQYGTWMSSTFAGTSLTGNWVTYLISPTVNNGVTLEGNSGSYCDGYIYDTTHSGSLNYSTTMDFTLNTKPTNYSDGIFSGRKSVNTSIKVQNAVATKVVTDSTFRLNINVLANCVITSAIDSSLALPMVVGGKYRMYISGSNTNLYAKLSLLATNGRDSISVAANHKYGLLTTPIEQPANTGSEWIGATGTTGNYTVTNIKTEHFDIKNVHTLFVGNSVGVRYDATSLQNHYTTLSMQNSGLTWANMSGGGNRFYELGLQVPQILAYNPKYVIVEAGLNNFSNNMRSYAEPFFDTLIAHGIKVIWLKLFNTIGKDTIFYNMCKQKNIKGVDAARPNLLPPTTDGIHPNDKGMELITYILKSECPEATGRTGGNELYVQTTTPTGWGLTGNAGTDTASNFIGTTDPQGLWVKSNSLTLAKYNGNKTSVSIGYLSNAYGIYSNAIGYNATAQNNRSFAAGESATAAANSSVAIGESSLTTGYRSLALGFNAKAYGSQSTAIGNTATTNASSAFAANGGTANAVASFALGSGTKSQSFAGIAVGFFNDSTVAASSTSYNVLNRAFQIGIGQDDATRANAMTVLFNGKTGIGTTTPDSTLHLVGGFKYDHITKGNGKLLQSDANGGASWVLQKIDKYNMEFTGSTSSTITTADTYATGTVRLYKNGVRLRLTADYTESGATQITLVAARLSGDVITIDYKY